MDKSRLTLIRNPDGWYYRYTFEGRNGCIYSGPYSKKKHAKKAAKKSWDIAVWERWDKAVQAWAKER